MSDPPSVRIHPSAEVSPEAEIGPGTRIWKDAQVRERARIGSGCVIGKNVYVDVGVTIGNNAKIQNNASLFDGVTLEDGVFIGPHVCLTNDRVPRAVNPDGVRKEPEDWTISPIVVRRGAALGASSVVIAGVTIGRWALVGAGSVVTRDVPAYALVAGNPARRVGSACRCGNPLRDTPEGSPFRGACPACGSDFPPADDPGDAEAGAQPPSGSTS